MGDQARKRGRPPKGDVPGELFNIRLDPALWQRFGEAAASAGTDRSSVIRAFVEWYAVSASKPNTVYTPPLRPQRPEAPPRTRATKIVVEPGPPSTHIVAKIVVEETPVQRLRPKIVVEEPRRLPKRPGT